MLLLIMTNLQKWPVNKMPTNREIYFKLLKENNKYLNKNVIISLLVDASKYDDRMVLCDGACETVGRHPAVYRKRDS